MNTLHPFLHEIDDYLRTELATARYPEDEQGGIYHSSERPVKRLGLLLEPFSGLPVWVKETQVDGLWIHRHWQLDLTALPPDVGIVAHHLPFDETLTIGYNLRLSRKLGAIGDPEPLGYKQSNSSTGELLPDRPIGMLIDVARHEFDIWLDTCKRIFGGYERAEAGLNSVVEQATSYRVAVVGAMTDALVREAAERGAQVYLTGAYRKPAQQAVDECGMAVVAVGHRRSEEWGLKELADLLHERWSIDCYIHQSTAISRL